MDTQNLQFTEREVITASLIPDELRIDFWPQHFGTIPQWLTLEPQIFAWMDRLCADYHGGIWNFSTLSNGGAFMAPEAESDEKWALFNSMNGNGAECTGEAAGIITCLMAYSHHACRTEYDAMTEHYYRLRDFAMNHPERSAIMHLID
ncbi:TPA: antirestriction protein [Yersinia enterocolitica]